MLLTIAAAASTMLDRCAPALTSGCVEAPADRDRRNGSSFMTLALRSKLRSSCRRGVVSSLSGLLSGLKRLINSAEDDRTTLFSLMLAVATSGVFGSELRSSILFGTCDFHRSAEISF